MARGDCDWRIFNERLPIGLQGGGSCLLCVRVFCVDVEVFEFEDPGLMCYIRLVVGFIRRLDLQGCVSLQSLEATISCQP